MKNRNLLAMLLAAVMAACIFAGCAAEAGDSYLPNEVTSAVDKGTADEIYDSNSTDAEVVPDRKLIRKVYLDAETEDMDALLSGINAKVTELDGYVESREVYTGSSYSTYTQSRRAELVVRIPAERLNAFITHVEGASNIISSSESADDVTLSYVATESRMKALQAEEERLLALIDKAANLTELLELEKRLTEVRAELESVTSQLRLYDNLVNYATVTLEITEVQKLTPTEEPGFWERIATGFTDSMANLWTICKECTILLVTVIPYFIPLLVFIAVVLIIVKLATRKKKNRKPPFPTDKPVN